MWAPLRERARGWRPHPFDGNRADRRKSGNAAPSGSCDEMERQRLRAKGYRFAPGVWLTRPSATIWRNIASPLVTQAGKQQNAGQRRHVLARTRRAGLKISDAAPTRPIPGATRICSRAMRLALMLPRVADRDHAAAAWPETCLTWLSAAGAGALGKTAQRGSMVRPQLEGLMRRSCLVLGEDL